MKIVLIHTTLATVESLSALVKQEIDGVDVVNILDDSILDQIIQGKELAQVEKRWLEYARIAESMDADAIISACSTVGEFAEKANRLLKTPVYRIDEGMVEKAIEIGGTINIFATLPSTLEPTTKLIKKKAKLAAKNCNINSILIPNAYEELMSGNRGVHDEKVLEQIMKLIDKSDVLVLAQASMASAIDSLNSEDKKKVLTSPLLGIKKIKNDLYKNTGRQFVVE